MVPAYGRSDIRIISYTLILLRNWGYLLIQVHTWHLNFRSKRTDHVISKVHNRTCNYVPVSRLGTEIWVLILFLCTLFLRTTDELSERDVSTSPTRYGRSYTVQFRFTLILVLVTKDVIPEHKITRKRGTEKFLREVTRFRTLVNEVYKQIKILINTVLTCSRWSLQKYWSSS